MLTISLITESRMMNRKRNLHMLTISLITESRMMKRAVTLTIIMMIIKIDFMQLNTHTVRLGSFYAEICEFIMIILYWCNGKYLKLGVIQKVRSLCRGWGVLKKRTKTTRGRGEGQAYLYVSSVKKIA